MVTKPPVAMSIAGSDSGGGAGIAADLKTFEAHGVWGTAAITAVTAQATTGVVALELVSASLVAEQIACVAIDVGIDAAKTGMLGSAAIVRAVADALSEHVIWPVVIDPVLTSKHGDSMLAGDDALDALRHALLPLATLVTPNLPEASALAGVGEITDRVGMIDAARRIVALGAHGVLVKGGHLGGDSSPDLLLVAGEEPCWLEGTRISRRHTHGTGCVLSAAIAAALAQGRSVPEACVSAKRFTERAIAGGFALGQGIGPVVPIGPHRIVSE